MIDVERSLEIFDELKRCKGATRAHKAIWKRLLVGQWYEALELARANSLTGSKTAVGLSRIMCEIYRSRRSSKARVTLIMNYVEEMVSEAESGLDIKAILSPLADQWSLDPDPDQGRGTNAQKTTINKARKQAEIKAHRQKQAEGKRKRKGGGKGRGKGEGKSEGKSEGEGTCADRTSRPPTLAHAREARVKDTAPVVVERVLIAPASDPYYRHKPLVDLAQGIARELPPPDLPDFPIRQEFTGRAPSTTRAAWIAYVDEVARRWPAPLNAHDLNKITGAPVRWTQQIIKDWRALLERGITEDQRRSMALALSAEAEAIAREALALVQSSGDERLKAAGLKLALDSLARRQSLIGADKINLEARVEVSTGSWTDHAAAAGLTGDELRQIGDIASRAISREGTEED